MRKWNVEKLRSSLTPEPRKKDREKKEIKAGKRKMRMGSNGKTGANISGILVVWKSDIVSYMSKAQTRQH